MTHGKNAEAVERQCRDKGLPFDLWPRFLRDKPELACGLELFFEAFLTLCTCRAIGMTAGPIPYTAVLEYAKHHDLDRETADLLWLHVSQMDNEYLRYHQESRSSDSGSRKA